jgi:hypothetical protein
MMDCVDGLGQGQGMENVDASGRQEVAKGGLCPKWAAAAAHMPQRPGVVDVGHLQAGSSSSTAHVRPRKLLLSEPNDSGKHHDHVSKCRNALMHWEHTALAGHLLPATALQPLAVASHTAPGAHLAHAQPCATADPSPATASNCYSSHSTSQPEPPSPNTPRSSGFGEALRTTRMLPCSLLVLAIGAPLPRVRNAGYQQQQPSTPTSTHTT